MQDDTTRQNEQPRTWLHKIVDAIVFRNEPFAAILFAKMLNWMYHPLCLWLIFCRYGDNIEKLYKPLFNVFSFCIYILIIQYLAIYDLLKWRTLHKWKRRLNVVIFFLFGNLSFIWLSFGRKRRLPLLCFVMAFLMTCLYCLSCFKFCIWLYPYNSIIYTLQYVFSAIGLILLNERISRKIVVSIIPILLGLCFLFLLWRHNMEIHQELEQIREQMTALLRYPATQQGARERWENGYPTDKEPLRSIIKSNDIQLPKIDVTSKQAEIKQAWMEFKEQHGAFIQAVDETAKLPPQAIQHEWKELAYEIPMPEMRVFRQATQYLALEIKANADNKETVSSCNQKMMNLRNWVQASSPSLISKSIACSIEAIRLDAIGYTLGHARYTQKEWEALLGEMPDWNYYCACALANEALSHENIHDFLLKNAHETDMLLSGDQHGKWHFWGVSYLAWSCFLDRDLLLGWRYSASNIQFVLAQPHDFKELQQQKEVFSKIATSQYAFISLMLLPGTYFAIIQKHDQIKDLRTIAMLAWQVMEYKHEHGGKLPENLETLGKVPVDSINGKPFAYEHGDMEIKRNRFDDDSIKVHGFHIMPDDEDINPATDLIVPLEQ